MILACAETGLTMKEEEGERTLEDMISDDEETWTLLWRRAVWKETEEYTDTCTCTCVDNYTL